MSVEETSAEQPPQGAGARLARAREEQGLSRTDIAQRTKIPERHLAAIEAGDFGALPARTYAVGFARSYARAVGLPENEIIAEVRRDLAGASVDQAEPPVFEPGDPARVPGARMAWLAALGGLAVAGAGAFYWGGWSLSLPGLPSILPAEAPPAPRPAARRPAPAVPAPLPSGPVAFTATTAEVWVRFSDDGGPDGHRRLFEKQLAQGESYTLPADAVKPRIWTGHPEALAITIGGRPVPRLAETQKTVKDVEVSAAALLARAAPSPAPT
ncbi:MAG: helix-turn-helix domain-containing protein, partial [Proteobacteria bacterium]|nr:helix-turn-helix domain-containing protein [Pseudomonadota bacterium]